MKIFFVVFLAFSSILLGRGPAVEPTFGISVDKHIPISVQKAKGFNFTEEFKDDGYGTLEKSNLEELIVLLMLLMGFPLIFFIFLKVNKRPKSEDQILEFLDKYPHEEEDKTKKAG